MSDGMAAVFATLSGQVESGDAMTVTHSYSGPAVTERIYAKDLRGISPESVCEACGSRIRGHAWADLDDEGFAVACSASDLEEG